MRPARITLLAVALIAILTTGIWLGGHPENLPGPVRDALVDDDRAVRAEVLDAIEDNFYRDVDESKLEDASLKGVVDSLDDRFSHYLTPKEAGQFHDSVSGEFEGVGMNVEEDAARAARAPRVRGLAGAPRRHPAPGSDRGRERPLDRRREQRGGHGAHQGPRGHVGHPRA